MITTLSTETLTASVLAVPPLARKADLTLHEAQNGKLIRHIEAGGIRTLLYGGNANFYHIPLSEFDQTLAMLEQLSGKDTLVIPSVGPAFGMMMDQAKIVGKHRFPIVMILPQQGVTTSEGVEEGVRRFVQAAGIAALLYVKHDGFVEPKNIQRLADDKVIAGIKYATVRENPAKDDYLASLVEHVDPKMIISGIGEQPAIIHTRDFGLGGFTSGCVCVAPRHSAAMLKALRGGDYAKAEQIRQVFRPLEDLRNAIHPIRVLHEAIRLAGIANMGPMLPLLSNLSEEDFAKVQVAAKQLLEADGKAG